MCDLNLVLLLMQTPAFDSIGDLFYVNSACKGIFFVRYHFFQEGVSGGCLILHEVLSGSLQR